MASIIKVDTIQDQNGNNIINESANTITIGASGDTITIPSGATLANSGIVTGFQSTGIDDNATSTAITIDSSEQVGIGTSSPVGKLDVLQTNNTTYSAANFISNLTARIHNDSTTTNSFASLGFRTGTGDNAIGFIYTGANQADFVIVNDGGGIGVERMRITNSGNVGIGTSSPSQALDIVDSTNYRQISISSSASTETKRVSYMAKHYDVSEEPVNLIGMFSDISTTTVSIGGGLGVTGNFNNSTEIQFHTASNNTTTGNSERMRIDSSGNVLVGKTATGLSTIGVEARPIGLFSATRDSNTPGYFTRTTTDGDIVQFLKDTTKVGSIFSRSGVVSGIILDPRAGGNGLLGQTGAIIPVDETQTREDNATDLGNSTYRWKDLYLGGGLYVGGTASANYLDDYEEGSWTPTVNTANGFSPGATNYTGTSAPRYTKIGNRVFLQCQVQMGNSSGNVALDDSITMTNLPFTPADVERNTVTEYRYNNNCAYMTSFLTATPSIISIVRFIKGTILRNGGSINININYTV